MSAESTNEQGNGLKRRQSHTPEPDPKQETQNKRQRTSPGKNSPTPEVAIRNDSIEGKKDVHTATQDRKASNAKDARRPSGIVDEKSKAKRLFGGLLGSLAQPGDRTTKRRQEIESRRKAELQQQDDARIEDKQKRSEQLAEKRKQMKKRLEGQNMRLRHETILHTANFLQTTTSPKLYYRPWELRAEEEDRIADQVREAKASIDRETGAEVATSTSLEGDSNGTKEEQLASAVDPKNSKDDEPRDRTALAVAITPASAPGFIDNGRAEPMVDEAAGKSVTQPDAGPASTSDQPMKVETENMDAESTTEKELAEPEEEHMVEGDEDTVIY